MDYPDITTTTAYQNLQQTGYIDGNDMPERASYLLNKLEELREAMRDVTNELYDEYGMNVKEVNNYG